jgi:hypothetical protein
VPGVKYPALRLARAACIIASGLGALADFAAATWPVWHAESGSKLIASTENRFRKFPIYSPKLANGFNKFVLLYPLGHGGLQERSEYIGLKCADLKQFMGPDLRFHARGSK